MDHKKSERQLFNERVAECLDRFPWMKPAAARRRVRQLDRNREECYLDPKRLPK